MGLFAPATNKSDFIILEEGVYTVKVKNIESYNHEVYGAGLKWTFACDLTEHPDACNDNGDPLVVSAITPTGMNPGKKARKWVETILGRELEEGETPDEDAIIGQRVRAMIKVDKRKDGSEWNKIDSLARLSGGGVRRPTVSQAARDY